MYNIEKVKWVVNSSDITKVQRTKTGIIVTYMVDLGNNKYFENSVNMGSEVFNLFKEEFPEMCMDIEPYVEDTLQDDYTNFSNSVDFLNEL